MFVCSVELVAEQLERLREEERFLFSLTSSSPLELESESEETKLRTKGKQIKGRTTSMRMKLINFRPEELSEVARSLEATSNRATLIVERGDFL